MTVISHETAVIEWHGKEFMGKVLAAMAVAIDYTMTKCVMQARLFHDYEDRTGHMTMSLQIFELAEVDPSLHRVHGAWGASANYGLYLEIGTSRPWSAAPRAEERAVLGHGNMWAIPPPLPSGPHTDTRWVGHYLPGSFVIGDGRYKLPGQGPLMEPRMSMRPAAAEQYPLLNERIRLAYYGEELV